MECRSYIYIYIYIYIYVLAKGGDLRGFRNVENRKKRAYTTVVIGKYRNGHLAIPTIRGMWILFTGG